MPALSKEELRQKLINDYQLELADCLKKKEQGYTMMYGSSTIDIAIARWSDGLEQLPTCDDPEVFNY